MAWVVARKGPHGDQVKGVLPGSGRRRAISGYVSLARSGRAGRLTPGVTERTWAALCDPTSAVHGLVAEQEDQLAGLAHLVLHATTWAAHPTCHLEDLYVAKPCRGGGVARRLIEAVYAFADGFGPPASTGSPRSTTPQHAPYTTPSPVGHRLSYTGAGFDRKLPRGTADAGGCPRLIRCGTPRQEIAGFADFPQGPLVHAEARVSTAESL